MHQYQDHAHPQSDQANTRSAGDVGCNHYQLHRTQPVHETIIHLSTCTGTQSVKGEVNECETEPNTNDIIVLLNEFRPPNHLALGTGMVCRADVFFPLSPTKGDRLIGTSSRGRLVRLKLLALTGRWRVKASRQIIES